MKRLYAAAAALVLLTSAASALDLTARFKDGEGAPVPNTFTPVKGSSCGENKDTRCLTLGDVVFQSLVQSYTDEQPTITGEEKFRRGQLALRVRGQKEVTLSAEDTVLVKRLVGKLFTPLIVAQAYALLDPVK